MIFHGIYPLILQKIVVTLNMIQKQRTSNRLPRFYTGRYHVSALFFLLVQLVICHKITLLFDPYSRVKKCHDFQIYFPPIPLF